MLVPILLSLFSSPCGSAAILVVDDYSHHEVCIPCVYDDWNVCCHGIGVVCTFFFCRIFFLCVCVSDGIALVYAIA